MFGVVAAHYALQTGELKDHGRHEIALGQVRRACCQFFIVAKQASKITGDLTHPLGFLRERAKLILKDDGFKPRREAGQRVLAVLSPEEGGIRETRADDSFIAGPDLSRVQTLDIGDGDKARQQASGWGT